MEGERWIKVGLIVLFMWDPEVILVMSKGVTPTSTDMCTVRPVDVLFILDSSSSVADSAFQAAKDFVDSFRKHVVIAPKSGFQISVMSFSDTAEVQFYLNKYHESSSLANAIRQVKYYGEGTNTAAALRMASVVFDLTTGMRITADVRHYVVVMTDGQSDDPRVTKLEADNLKTSGSIHKIFSIGIGNVDPIELQDIASAPDKDIPETVLLVANYSTLLTLVEQMVDITCDGVDSCRNNTCVNGDCIHTVDSYTCGCHSGYKGANCELDINECGNPDELCLKGGKCVNSVGSYTCICRQGFTGKECQTKVGHCYSSPCISNHICIETAQGYICECPSGFTGDHCQTDIDECASSPCLSDGTCLDLVNGYTCNCLDTYSGDRCQFEGNYTYIPIEQQRLHIKTDTMIDKTDGGSKTDHTGTIIGICVGLTSLAVISAVGAYLWWTRVFKKVSPTTEKDLPRSLFTNMRPGFHHSAPASTRITTI